MSSPASPSLLSLLIADAAIIGYPILTSSPVSEILSPRPIRRVSFDALVRLADAFEPAITTTTTRAIIAALITANNSTNRELLSGSTPEYGWREKGERFGVVGGERKRGVGVIGGERRLKK